MKKLVLFVCLSLTILISHAQFNPGQKVIGGQVLLNLNSASTSTPAGSSTVVSQRGTSIGLNLSLSKFKTPTVLNGMGIFYGYTHNRNDISSSVEQKNTNNSIGAFVNKTKLKPLAKNFYLSFTGAITGVYQFGDTKTVQLGNSSKRNAYAAIASGSMGVLYQVSQRFLVSGELSNLLSLGYNHSTETLSGTTSSKSTSDAFNFSTGLNGFSLNNLSFGVRYLL